MTPRAPEPTGHARLPTVPPNRTKGSAHDSPDPDRHARDPQPASDRDDSSAGEDARSARRGRPPKEHRNRRQTAPARPSRHSARTGAHAIPTPEQWAQQQLANAPERSRQWAEDIARFYGLDLPD